MSKTIDIISGTEQAYQTDKPTPKQQEDFNEVFKKHKEDYLAKNTIEDMVYENGSALALLYKEVTRLNQLLTTKLQHNGNKKTSK
jgi:hypothetical protein